MAKVNIDLSIRGHRQISDALYSEEFDVVKKTEWEGAISSSDGYVDLPISKLAPISKIIGYSENGYKIKVTYNSHGVSESFASGVSYWTFDPVYASDISGVAVGTDLTSEITAGVSIITV